MKEPTFTFGIEGFKSSADRVANEREQRVAEGKRIIPYGVAYLDDCTRGILRNDLVVLGALTGAGKTSLATGIAERAAREGKRVHFFALEAEPNEIERRLKFRLICKQVYSERPWPPWAYKLDYLDWRIGRLDSLLDKYERAADQEMQQYRNLVTYYRGRDFRVEDIEKLFRAVQDQSDLIILDHLHYVDFDDSTSENAAIRRIVVSIRDVALDIGIPVIALAHLRKSQGGRMMLVPHLSDFHGTSEITKRATVVIVLAPAIDAPHEDAGMARTYVCVAKHRARGVSGLVARHDFHLSARQYSQTYELGRISMRGDEFNPLIRTEIPRWAERARPPEEVPL